jgi:HD superfamily phosphohydrolase
MEDHKILYDAIHGFIKLNPIEALLLSMKPLRRLESIHQMGAAYFLYPTARHTRYEHSLGVMLTATKIYDAVTKKSKHPDVPEYGSKEYEYWRQVLRLAALCHDIGHPPFSHTGEKMLLGPEGHEAWSAKLIKGKYLAPVWEYFPGVNIMGDVAKIAVGGSLKGEVFSPWEKILTEMITGDVFGADRFDYLLRDSYFTGLSYGKIDDEQIIEMLRIVSDNAGQLVLGVEEAGIDACDFLLIGRYFMYRRVYQHRTVRALGFHLSRFLKIFFEDKNFLQNEDNYLSWTDHEVLSELNKVYDQPDHPGFQEARSIYDRNYRYAVFNITEEEFNAIIEKNAIPKKYLCFEKGYHTLSRDSLLFPVIRKNGSINRSDCISDFSIQSKLKNWVYVAPEHEQALLNLMNT